MIRDEMRRFREVLSNISSSERTAYATLFFVFIVFFGGLIYYFSPFDMAAKHLFFTLATIVGFGLAVIAYRHERSSPRPDNHKLSTRDNGMSERDKKNQATTAPQESVKPTIPKKPSKPPTVGFEKEATNDHSEEFEVADEDVIMKYKEENPSLYRRPFSIKPVIFKIVLIVAVWIGFLIGAIAQASPTAWGIFAGLTVVALIYCYYLILRWNGEEFIVNDTWFERPLTMPFPFPSKTPAIRRSEIGSYEFKQTTLDKLFDTCRLFSDTPAARDKQFHNVKWLTHPAELRRASGISAPRKNSWLSPFRKNKG
jgi:hypothetical protein